MARHDRQNADGVLIAALAGGATHEAAATAAGVSIKTVQRRMADAEFKHQVQTARAELIEHAVGLLAKASTAAVATLAQLLDKSTPPAVRLGAARAIIELGGKLREQQDIEQRLAALEERLNQSEKGIRRWGA